MTFEELKLNKQLLNAVAESGYKEPTEIQAKAIPQILAGHDILGIAQTGTGKTAAYLLPLIYKLKFAQGQHPRAIILVPTRELALQIGEELRRLSKYTDLRFAVLYGGSGTKLQIEAVQKGIDIVLGTPGRIIELYLSGELILKTINTFVLDEADRMMDMGFMPQIRKLLEVLPRKRQNLLFSATMPPKVITLSEEFLEFPMRIEVTPQATTAKTVDQVLYHVPNLKTKINLLQYLLNKEDEFTRVIVFVRTKKHADNIYKFIKRKVEDEVRVIHANKSQNSRINAIEAFRQGKIRVLVATDVAARGIDISMVSHVINFDVPLLYEEYVHRIGRTGRANQSGKAIMFANEAEILHVKKIEKLIRMALPVEPIPDEVEIAQTEFEEQQAINREIDNIRKKENPDFQGAFHEKKRGKSRAFKKRR
ncbi:MAG: DEAD/DEAH box helicase [Cytophagaceae bacterium]|nr:DEAD/DEAH box helicase [Cytophagaceae bacterium]MDW8455680.1 DEAD/DEAH box helicase [Cytophagaceae bacterium]